MLKTKLILITLLLSLMSINLNATNYFCVGYDYALPTTDFKKDVSNAQGLQFKFENRHYCHIWFGANFNYWVANLKEQDAINPPESFFMITPKFQINVVNIRDYSGNLVPFLGAGLVISNIEIEDKINPFGIGAMANTGVSYGFKIFGRCTSLDLELKYNLPNIIYRGGDREKFQLINVGLSLGICL